MAEQNLPEDDSIEIARLRGTDVPGWPGYSFGDRMAADGDRYDIEIVNSDGESIGTARGETLDEVLASADSAIAAVAESEAD